MLFIKGLAIALFVAVMWLWATLVNWVVSGLSERALFFGAGIPFGMAIMLAIWRYEERYQRKRTRSD